VTPKTAPAAQNRFIYYPDHLVRMPGPGQQMTDILKAFIFEPAFKGIASGLYREITSPKRPDTLADESIGSFISRRISPHIADNLASALFHGIYAGDIYKLSAKTIMPIPWMREGKHGSLANAAFQQMTEKTSWNFCDDMELQTKLQETEWDPELEQRMADCSVFTYRRGLGQMTERLEQKLINNGNIKIMKNTKIDQLEKDKDTSKIKARRRALSTLYILTLCQLTYSSTEVTPTVPSFITSDDPRTYTHVVSTLPPQTTFSLFPPDIQSTRSTSMHRPLSTTMTSTPAVTVCVVNLYFKTPFLLTTLNPPGGLPESITHLEGFGYLLPRTLPFTQNPERALGVIFDSDISPDVHSTVSHADKGTRLTVMLGGHWWDGWTSFPDEAEAEEMALNVLARHLGIVEEPVAVRATLQQNCIPQYTVGHTARMSEAHTGLLEHFSGKLRVAGSWYTNVGVNDCLRAAYEVVQGLTKEVKHGEQGRNGDGEREGRTGLEKFAWGRPLALVKKEALGEVEVVEIEEKAMKMGYFEGVRVSKKQGQGVRRDE
jgi:protoporphyrinogen oxidase